MLRDTDEKSEPSEHGPGIPLNHSALLLDVLDYKPWEFVGVFHKVNGSAHAVVRRLTDVRGYIAELPENADVYFGVCPTKGPARDRAQRTDDEVTRLPALWADL